jgi:hypothetical protein
LIEEIGVQNAKKEIDLMAESVEKQRTELGKIINEIFIKDKEDNEREKDTLKEFLNLKITDVAIRNVYLNKKLVQFVGMEISTKENRFSFMIDYKTYEEMKKKLLNTGTDIKESTIEETKTVAP